MQASTTEPTGSRGTTTRTEETAEGNMYRLEDCFLCPENHISNNANRCDCGSTNLISLAKILDRTADSVGAALEMVREFNVFKQSMELPSMKTLFPESEVN